MTFTCACPFDVLDRPDVMCFNCTITALGKAGEWCRAQAEKATQKVKIIGELAKDKEIAYNPEIDANYFSFYIKDDNDQTEKVVYIGPKPQDFEMSEKVVVTGRYHYYFDPCLLV